MRECQDCEYRGYSPQFCRVHVRHCSRYQGSEVKTLPAPVKICAKALAGVGVGIGVAIIGSTALSLVGGAALIHALLLKLGAGAGLTGGGIGLYRGLAGTRRKSHAGGATGKDVQAFE